MKRIFLLLLLLFLPIGRVSAVDLSDQVEPIIINATVEFDSYDRQLIDFSSFNDNGYNGSSTLSKTIWVGGFPLVEGIAGDVDFSKVPKLMYGNVSAHLVSFDGNGSVQVSVVAKQVTTDLAPKNGIVASSTSVYGVFSAMMEPNQTSIGSFEFATAHDPVELSNGSEMWKESYTYLLEYTNSTINYGMFQVFLTANTNWTFSAKVELEIQTINNPVFFEMMEQRYFQFFPTSNLTSSILNSTASSSILISRSQLTEESSINNGTSFRLVGLFALPAIVFLRRKIQKAKLG